MGRGTLLDMYLIVVAGRGSVRLCLCLDPRPSGYKVLRKDRLMRLLPHHRWAGKWAFLAQIDLHKHIAHERFAVCLVTGQAGTLTTVMSTRFWCSRRRACS